jgi:hypothetical protein
VEPVKPKRKRIMIRRPVKKAAPAETDEDGFQISSIIRIVDRFMKPPEPESDGNLTTV